MSVVDKIYHYQRNIEKCGDDVHRILHCVSKLYELPITVQHLQETGVGRTVNGLRKYDGTVGDASKALIAKWKAMVANENTSEEDEEENHVPENIAENCVDECELVKQDIEKSGSSNQLQGSEDTHKRKESKKSTENEISTEQDYKHLTKSSMEHKKHEKSKHSSRYHSESETKSKESKNIKSSSKKDEAYGSKEHYHSKSDNLGKIDDKTIRNNEVNNRKRTLDNSSSSSKVESKRLKLSSTKNEETTHLSTSEKSHSSSISSEIKIKTENDKDKQRQEKKSQEESRNSSSKVKFQEKSQEESRNGSSKVKPQEKSQEESRNGSSKAKPQEKLQEESRNGSSKAKSQESSHSKIKDTCEKQKHKKEEQVSHKKHDTRKDSSHSSKTSESKVSSSTKDHVKNKDSTDNKREHKDDKNKHEKSQGTKKRLAQEIISNEGIDNNSGASFAEALSMCIMPQTSRKRTNNSSNTNPRKLIKTEPVSPPPSNTKKTPTMKTEPEYNGDPNSPSLLAPNVKLEPLNVDLASTLPEISPNYKPLPHVNPIHRKEEVKLSDDMIYVKNQRTKVYSGNKVGYTRVPTLSDLCMRVLIENIDALEFTGGVPYDILKPVLERATPDQLFVLENYNPYLIGDTDTLWEFHCNREFRTKQRQEMETWRDMYMRCLDEREAKLKALTANIKQSIDNSVPVRSAKLAYVDNIVKPPRNILKKQAKYGTANAGPATISDLKKKLVGGSGTNNATNIAVPPPSMSRFKTSASGTAKKTKAPLMAKALQLIKGRYKR